MNEQYTQNPKRLTKASHARNNGVVMELNHTIKAVWLYMYDRWSFFKSQGKDYYENQDSIAGELAVDRRTLIRMFPKFEEAGIIRVFKQKVAGKKESNRYTFIMNPTDCELLCNDVVLKASDFPLGKTYEKPVQKQVKQVVIEYEDPDIPF